MQGRCQTDYDMCYKNGNTMIVTFFKTFAKGKDSFITFNKTKMNDISGDNMVMHHLRSIPLRIYKWFVK